MGHIQSFDDLIAFVLRRKWLILAVTLIGMALAVVYAKTRPDTFEAAAVIQVEAPQVTQIAPPTGQLPAKSLSEVLQSVEQQLTSRENMLAVIDRHRLFSDGLTPDQKIALLRRSVTFQTVASVAETPGVGPGVSAMIITVRLGEAEQAARVANDFAQGLLDEGNASQTQRTRETLAFYQEETRRIEGEIATLEAEVSAYRTSHADGMPAVRSARAEELTGLDTDLRAVERDLAGLNGQKALLEQGGVSRATDRRQLQDLEQQISVAEAQRQSLITRRRAIETALADAAEIDRAMSGYDRRAAQLKAQYELASRNLAEAETASRLTERQQTGRITLLDRAITPEYAVSGGGKKMAIAGALASLLAGLGLAFLCDLIRPVIRTADQMERELDLRPVVSIPDLDRRRPPPAARRRDETGAESLSGPGEDPAEAGPLRQIAAPLKLLAAPQYLVTHARPAVAVVAVVAALVVAVATIA